MATRIPRTWFIIAGVVSLGLLAAGSTVAQADTSAQQACAAYARSSEASGLPQRFADSACSWAGRVIRDAGVGITVPAAGGEVRLDTVGLAGSRSLRVVHTKDGLIEVFRDSGAAAQDSSSSRSTPMATCSDSAFNLEGFRVYGGYSFSYNSYSAPANVASATAAALTSAFTNASTAATDCNGTRRPGPAAHYLGTVAGRFANISTSYTCASPDGYNTVSWLSGPTQTLAMTCMWFSAGVLRQSDAVMNRNDAFFTGRIPAGCSSAFDLVGVMTHEAGHTYGLDHADAGSSDHSLHANQTMNSLLSPCTTKFRTFGTGDLNAMTALY